MASHWDSCRVEDERWAFEQISPQESQYALGRNCIRSSHACNAYQILACLSVPPSF